MTKRLRDIATPDQQVETPDGAPVGATIAGVQIHKPVIHVDHRGALFEVYDGDPQRWPDPIVWIYHTSLFPGVIKGWFVHDVKVDRYTLAQGELLCLLYDDRPDSTTSGVSQAVMLSERGNRQITIPAGVWHLIVNVGPSETTVINCPTTPYHPENPDRRGLPWDTDEIPVDVRKYLPAAWS